MAVKFNPFSGQLQIDEKGASASYIDGEVAFYNDLPLSSTTAPLDSAWLVRGSSGVWPFTKPGGVYIRTATGGSSRDADYTYAGVFPDVFSDANFTIYDDADTSKNLKFQLSGIPTATTRTVDAPAGSGRMLVEGQSIGSTTAAAGTFTSLKADSLILPSTGAPLIYLNTSSGQVSAASVSAGSYTTSSGGNYTIASGGSLIFDSGSSVSGQIVANNGTLTASAPVLDLSQTWNNSAVTFTGLKFNITATAATPNSMFADIQAGGYSQFAIARISSTSNACWIYNTNSGTNTNGVGANYERGFMRWSSNVLQIGTEKLGTGSARALELQTDGTTRLTISAGGSVTAAGTLIGGPIQSNSHVRVAAVSQLEFGSGGSRISNQSSGVLTLHDSALSDFGRLQFGGTTSSFPALKRSSTALQVRLADDSAFAPFEARDLSLTTAGAAGQETATTFTHGRGSNGDSVRLLFLPRGSANSAANVEFIANGVSGPSATMSFRTNGATQFQVGGGSGIVLAQNIGFSASTPIVEDITLAREAANILGQRNAGNGQTYRLYNTFASTTSFERLNIRWASNECIIDAEAGSGGGTLRGIKIGSATSSLLGFYGATPVTQRAAIADATDAATTQARLNDLLAAMRSLGLIAT